MTVNYLLHAYRIVCKCTRAPSCMHSLGPIAYVWPNTTRTITIMMMLQTMIKGSLCSRRGAHLALCMPIVKVNIVCNACNHNLFAAYMYVAMTIAICVYAYAYMMCPLGLFAWHLRSSHATIKKM